MFSCPLGPQVREHQISQKLRHLWYSHTWIFQVCKIRAFSLKKGTKGQKFYISIEHPGIFYACLWAWLDPGLTDWLHGNRLLRRFFLGFSDPSWARALWKRQTIGQNWEGLGKSRLSPIERVWFWGSRLHHFIESSNESMFLLLLVYDGPFTRIQYHVLSS